MDKARAPHTKAPGLGDYAAAFRTQRARPSEVADLTASAIVAADELDPPLACCIALTRELARRDAAASDARWARGEPRSPIDGVPVLVKDNIDVAGVPTTNGTLIDFPVPARHARVVERLRAAGAVIVGKANLHEIGAGTTGINPSRGTARNPHDPGRWCGGSSSGSACAVGAALVPLAIGTDAGGSVRAPAAFCGAVGLKPTFGRVSRRGMSIVCDTLDHIGPITRSCEDAALALELLSAVEEDDDETWDQPPLPGGGTAAAAVRAPVAGMRVGFARHLLDSPRLEPAVGERVAAAAEAVAAAGAVLVDVEIPDVDMCLDIGLILLAAEGPSGMEEILYANEHLLGADLQVLLRVGEQVTARDYMLAQRARHSVRLAWAELLETVEAVLLPGPGIPAGPIRRDALLTGELDEATSAKAIAFTFPSNLTGYPAVCAPVGQSGGLPVAAQVVAPPWRELDALRVARVWEQAGLSALPRPRRYYGDRVLPDQGTPSTSSA